MLLLSMNRFLATVLPLVVLYPTSTAAASSNETDSDLWEIVPKCARTCLKNFIETEYSSNECTMPSNIRCLCRTSSTSGLTIGEAGLSCAYSLCSTEVFESSEVYNICKSVSNALAKTHATITATTFAAPTSTVSDTTITSPKIASYTNSATATKLTTSALNTTPGTSSSTVAITVFHSTSTASGETPTTTSIETSSTTFITMPTVSNSSSNSTASTQKKHVSPGTVIGVSVTSGVASSFLIGVAVFYCCKRWRKKHCDTEKIDFEIGGTMSEPLGFSAQSSRHGSPRPGPGLGPGSGLGLSTLEENNLSRTFNPPSQPHSHHMFTRSPNSQTPRGEDRIGFAVTSVSDGEETPPTSPSQRTLSRLLPTVLLYPRPLKWSHRPSSGETVFEEDQLQPGMEKKPRAPQKPSSLNPMAGLPANPRALKNGFPAQKYQRIQSPQSPLNPGLRTAPAGPRSAQPKVGPSFAERALQLTSSNTNNLAPSSTVPSQRISIRLLTPPTFYPDLEAQTNATSPKKPGSPKPIPPPKPINSGKVIPQPRVIRGDDIKRVEIKRSPRPLPNEVTPFCPDDFWFQWGRPLPPTPGDLPSESYPTTLILPATHDNPHQSDPKRISPTSRNLTPSRRGGDLILSVD